MTFVLRIEPRSYDFQTSGELTGDAVFGYAEEARIALLLDTLPDTWQTVTVSRHRMTFYHSPDSVEPDTSQTPLTLLTTILVVAESSVTTRTDIVTGTGRLRATVEAEQTAFRAPAADRIERCWSPTERESLVEHLPPD